MPKSYLAYALDDGYVDHWLVAGPSARPLELPFDRDAIAESRRDPSGVTTAQPVHLATFEFAGEKLRWDVISADADHLLHLDDCYGVRHYLRSWASVEILSPTAWTGAATLTTHGPVDLWVNGRRAGGHRRFSQDLPVEKVVELTLEQGVNRIWVSFDQVGEGATIYTLGLRLPELVGATVQLRDDTGRTKDFQAYERLFELASLERDVFIAGDDVAIHWPDDLEAQCAARDIPAHPRISLRAQKPDGRIIAETLDQPRAGEPTETVPALNLPLGAFQTVLMPDPETYAEGRVRARRAFDLSVLPVPHEAVDTRSYAERLYEAVHLAMRQEDVVLRTVAAMTLGAWQYVDGGTLVDYVKTVLPHTVDRDRRLLALLGALYHYGAHQSFPQALAGALEGAVELFENASVAADGEVSDLLCWAIRILAGQRYPERELSQGVSGRVLREQAEAEVTDRLFRAGRYGLRAAADDGESLDTLIFALAHLADLAETTLVRELAAILLDKVLFTVALNSYEGVGRGGLLGATATIGRVVWGSGVLNTHLWSPVGLANARSYPIPPLIPRVGRGTSGEGGNPDAAWQTECHKAPDGTWSYRRVTYRTPVGMLTSIRGPAPFAGTGWRAVLGAEATVTVNAPVHAGTRPDVIPNFWHGDASPPRVAQWQDALIAWYDLDGDAGMGFTHAHVPIYAFDAFVLRDNWAFVRKGDAYLALTASSPLILMRNGPGAHRELRAYGARSVWLCRLSTAAEDGDFAGFQRRVSATETHFEIAGEDGAVRWTTARGVAMELDAAGQLTVDGELRGDDRLHYRNPYCTVEFPAEHMDIRIADEVLRLDFSA